MGYWLLGKMFAERMGFPSVSRLGKQDCCALRANQA
jgi:hypothetical protein